MARSYDASLAENYRVQLMKERTRRIKAESRLKTSHDIVDIVATYANNPALTDNEKLAGLETIYAEVEGILNEAYESMGEPCTPV